MSERLANLPNPLIGIDGGTVTGKHDWVRKRRGEIVELFREHVYGRAPVERPKSMRIRCEAEDLVMNGAAVRKRMTIVYEGPGGSGKLPFVLFVPSRTPKPVPAFLLINNRGERVADPDRK